MPLRDGQHIGLFLGQDLFAKGHVQILRWPIGIARSHVAHLKMLDAELLGQALRFFFQGLRRRVVLGRHATVDGKRQARQ